MHKNNIMKETNSIQTINNQTMDNEFAGIGKLNSIGKSMFHLFVYVSLLTLISVAATAQCDDVSLACNNSINVSTNSSCIADICLDLILENMVNGFTEDDYTITLRDQEGNPLNGTTAVGNCVRVDDTHVAMTVQAVISLDICGVSCWGYVNIEDKVGPSFVGCDNSEFGFGTSDISCADFLDGVGSVNPTVAGDCTDVTISFEDVTSDVQCSGPFTGDIIRTYTAVDGVGNVTTCRQRFRILGFDLADVVFPEDTIHFLGVSCDIPDISPENLGQPMGVQCPNIVSFFNDIQTPTCGAEQKFLRNWTVVDWCTGDSRTEGQVVKILDVLPPISVCPPDTLTFPASGVNCAAKIVLDPFAVVDSSSAPQFVSDCSGPVTFSVEFLPAQPNTDQPIIGPYISVPMGSDSLFTIPQLVEDIVWVRYCFVDACGNGPQINDATNVDPADFVNCCFFEVQVTDNIPPTAICEGFTKVSLGPDGTVDIPSMTINDNSFDACGSIVDVMARRVMPGCGMVTTFGNSVRFCCADLGETLSVELKVIDDDGNESACFGRVCVEDNAIPTFTCPGDVTIDCMQDFRDPAIVNSASSVNGCQGIDGADGIDFDLSNFDEDCMTGIVVRQIVFTNNSGDTINTCLQNINVTASDTSSLLLPGDFIGPDDVTVDMCSTFSIDASVTGMPTTTKSFGCANIGITFEDSAPIQSNQPGVCNTIIRTWTVVNWCRFDPINPDGNRLLFSQIISIRNDASPVLNCPDMYMISTDTNNCRADVEFGITVEDVCATGSVISYGIDIDSDSIVNLTGVGDSIIGNFPVGEHILTFTAFNECQGAPSECTIPFIIKGDRPPLPICLSSITWTINDQGVAVVNASDFDLKSEGGCNGTDSLTFSFVAPTDISFPAYSQTFTCSDITNGVSEMIRLEVFIIDESGVFESCIVILDLQDSNDICQDVGSSNSLITGNIMTEMEEPLESVMVHLENMDDASTSFDMTDVSGGYAFDNIGFYNDYTITPDHNVDHLNGINTIDLIKIQRHVLGLERFDSPYKLIAADVNDDNRINGLDLIQLRKMILGVFTEFPQNDSWLFVPESHTFEDESNPWDFETEVRIDDLLATNMEANFTAVKVGDVNNSAVNNSVGKVINENAGSNFYLSAKEQEFRSGELVGVPFTVEEDAEIYGLQFTMEFDTEKLLFQGVDSGVLEVSQDNFALLNNNIGKITFSVSSPELKSISEGESLFYIYFESKESGQLSQLVDMSSTVVKSELYTDNQVRHIDYVFRAQQEFESEIELFQNKPNPFSDFTNIAFYVPQSQKVSLTIYNAEGQMLMQKSGNFESGINEFLIDASEIASDGLLIYRLNSGASSVTRKMLLIR